MEPRISRGPVYLVVFESGRNVVPLRYDNVHLVWLASSKNRKKKWQKISPLLRYGTPKFKSIVWLKRSRGRHVTNAINLKPPALKCVFPFLLGGGRVGRGSGSRWCFIISETRVLCVPYPQSTTERDLIWEVCQCAEFPVVNAPEMLCFRVNREGAMWFWNASRLFIAPGAAAVAVVVVKLLNRLILTIRHLDHDVRSKIRVI